MVSIIVLNYNDGLLTERYVNSISAYHCLDHIVIVDNCSPDGSYEYLKKLESDKIVVLKAEGNNGYGAGNNFGVRYVVEHCGDKGIVIISNPDIQIEESAMSNIINFLKIHSDIFAATGEVFTLTNKRIPLFTWKLPTIGMLFVECSTCLKILFRKLFKYSKRYCDVSKIETKDFFSGEVLPGCFFALDISKMIEVGMFNENTFLYYEEEILFAKAKNKGYKSKVIKNSPLMHTEGATTKKNISSWYKRDKYIENSCVIYIRDCLGTKTLLIFLYKACNRFFLLERYICSLIKAYIC